MSNGLRKWSTNFSIAAVVLLPIWMLQLSFQKRAPTSSRSDPPVRPITSWAVDRVHTPETLRKSSASNNLSNSTAISYTLFNKVPHRVAKGKKSLLLGGKGTIYQGGHPPVGRGEKNVAFADFSTSPGGKDHVAQGRRTFVAGKGTRASLQGAFVWAGKSENIFKSIKNIHFTARADSNSGVAWPPGSVSFSSLRSIHQRHDACVTF
jgi:hypothetical protein